jgi:hypothetical protein
MTERDRILRKLDGYSREFFLLTEHWTLDDWKKIRDKEYYDMMSMYGRDSLQFCRFKMKRIMNVL